MEYGGHSRLALGPGFGEGVVFERALSSGYLRCSGGYSYLTLVRETEIERAATLGPNPKLDDLLKYFLVKDSAPDGVLRRYTFAAQGEDLLLGDVRPTVGVLSPWIVKVLALQKRPQCTWQNFGSATELGQDLSKVRVTSRGDTWYEVESQQYSCKSKVSLLKKLQPTGIPGYFSASGLQPGDYDMRLDATRPVWWHVPKGVMFSGVRQKVGDWVCFKPADCFFLLVVEAVERLEFVYGVSGTDLELVDSDVLKAGLTNSVFHDLGFVNHYGSDRENSAMAMFILLTRHPSTKPNVFCSDTHLMKPVADLASRGDVDCVVDLVHDDIPREGFLLYDASDSEFVERLKLSVSSRSGLVLLEASFYQKVRWATDNKPIDYFKQSMAEGIRSSGLVYVHSTWNTGSHEAVVLGNRPARLRAPMREGRRFLSVVSSNAFLVVMPPGSRVAGPDLELGWNGEPFMLHVTNAIDVAVDLPPGKDTVVCFPLVDSLWRRFRDSAYYYPYDHIDRRVARSADLSLVVLKESELFEKGNFPARSMIVSGSGCVDSALRVERFEFDTGGLCTVTSVPGTYLVSGATSQNLRGTDVKLDWCKILASGAAVVVTSQRLNLRFPVTGLAYSCQLKMVRDIDDFDCLYDCDPRLRYAVGFISDEPSDSYVESLTD